MSEGGADHCGNWNWFLGGSEEFLAALLTIKVGGHGGGAIKHSIESLHDAVYVLWANFVVGFFHVV